MPAGCFQRTYEELKPRPKLPTFSGFGCFQRTYEELKQRNSKQWLEMYGVFSVPMRN